MGCVRFLSAIKTAQRLLSLPLVMPAHLTDRWGSRRTAERGFTLPEVITVVVIIIVAAVLAIPSYMSWYARSQLKQALTELHSNLNVARMSAMNRNSTVTVTLAMVSGRVTASFGGVLPPQVMSSGVTGFAGGPVQFSSLGTRVGGGAANQTITLNNITGVTFEIQVTPAGKARWCTTSPCPP